VGNVFEVDAVLCSGEILHDEQLNDPDSPYLCSMAPNSDEHTHRKVFHRHTHGHRRSNGKFHQRDLPETITKDIQGIHHFLFLSVYVLSFDIINEHSHGCEQGAFSLVRINWQTSFRLTVLGTWKEQDL
jgi:hypothetical protein